MNQIIQSGYILCFAAKWLGTKEIIYSSIVEDGKKKMLSKAHKLLDEADVVIHYNGKSFDIPMLNGEFVSNGLLPPSPYRQIDLLRVIRSKFRFVSNKMAYVAKHLGIGAKVSHEGHELWIKCMNGDLKAWKTMKKYNIQDTNLLEDMYAVIRPWITNHPNPEMYNIKLDKATHRPENCPVCSSKKLQARGRAVTNSGIYHRFQCQDCGAWSRAKYSEVKDDKKKSLLVSL